MVKGLLLDIGGGELANGAHLVASLAEREPRLKPVLARIGLTTLAVEGLIEQDRRTGGYRLGLVVFELGEAVRVHLGLHAAAGPVLSWLRDHTGESSQVGVLDGSDVVYVDRLERSHSLRLFTETGRRVPVHCTSSGKVLLAYLPDEQSRAVLTHLPLPALTPHTLTEPAVGEVPHHRPVRVAPPSGGRAGRTPVRGVAAGPPSLVVGVVAGARRGGRRPGGTGRTRCLTSWIERAGCGSGWVPVLRLGGDLLPPA